LKNSCLAIKNFQYTIGDKFNIIVPENKKIADLQENLNELKNKNWIDILK
jgi:hypothetical protein